MSMIGSPFIGGGGVVAGTYPLKGNLDATLAANLPSSPNDGDVYRISVAGNFQDDASIFPANYDFTVGDQIIWVQSESKWQVMESGDDALKATNNLSDLNSASTARTNLSVPSVTEATSTAVAMAIAL